MNLEMELSCGESLEFKIRSNDDYILVEHYCATVLKEVILFYCCLVILCDSF